MKTISNEEQIETVISGRDEALLTKYIELFAPLIRLPRIGKYANMGSEEVWQRLVSQVCVMGSARHMERLQADKKAKKNFDVAISIREIEKQKRKRAYLATILANFSATRFPNKAADSLVGLLKTKAVFDEDRFVLFKNLSHKNDANHIRHQLIQRCPVFRLKSASDFMIEAGLSRDVIALDTRIVGVLKDYFDYNLGPGQVQANIARYYSLEDALRKYCQKAGKSLAVLDRVLFRYSGMTVFQMMAKHPGFF